MTHALLMTVWERGIRGKDLAGTLHSPALPFHDTLPSLALPYPPLSCPCLSLLAILPRPSAPSYPYLQLMHLSLLLFRQYFTYTFPCPILFLLPTRSLYIILS